MDKDREVECWGEKKKGVGYIYDLYGMYIQ